MEYKDLIQKIAKMHHYYTNGVSVCSNDCPLRKSSGVCKSSHSMIYLVGLLDEIERTVAEWKKPVDWEAISERAKTEDIKVFVWNDDKTKRRKRYFYRYDPANSSFPFIAVDDGRTRWTSNDATGWKHAELVNEELT